MASGSLKLDLDVDAGRERELHQRVHGLRSRIDNVEHALVRADFELFARLLVDVRRTVDGEFLNQGRQRNRTAHRRARALGSVDDLSCRVIQHTVVKGLEPDAYVLPIHIVRVPLSARLLTSTVSKTGPKLLASRYANSVSAKTKWPARRRPRGPCPCRNAATAAPVSGRLSEPR